MIESLHSPHIARVKALIGSKGAKERDEQGLFVAEGIQCAREALSTSQGPEIKTLYATAQGLTRLEDCDFSKVELIEVSDAVMKAMSDTVTPQGIVTVCYKPELELDDFSFGKEPLIVYLYQIQDPGNAGTILRSADAMGVDAVVVSPESVDMFSPKVVRATAGSLWNIPVIENVQFPQLARKLPQSQKYLLSSHATTSIDQVSVAGGVIAIFGNEARGVTGADLGEKVSEITIPMKGRAESLNLSAAAAITIFTLSAKVAG
jgi:TrmH family RNA methyltransferase